MNFRIQFALVVILPAMIQRSDAGLTLDNESELREAQAALFTINSQSGWLLLNYANPTTLHFTAGGQGTSDEIVPQLQDDQIQYGVVRIGGIQDQGTLKRTSHDIFFTWIGPSVGIIEKGRKSAFLGDVEGILQPFRASVTILNRGNFNDEKVLEVSHPLYRTHVID